ncbi:MAG: class I SAM-dependent methyltransferase [Planctomycetia bacterium]|nr:class I SAM-dependent methyltransferase [Planctomycetia bacterium]
MNCRMCKSHRLRRFLDLEFTPPADSFLRKEQLREPETHYPLEVVSCSDCGLAQLSYVVSPEVLYRHDYPYEASLTQTGRRHWDEFARNTCQAFGLTNADLVVDIGSNVGVLLECFHEYGPRILGVDPASNIVRLAERRGIETINEFFNPDVARAIVRDKGQASVVTGTNVFAHIDDVDTFMVAVDALLNKNGIFIFEAPYLANLLDSFQYDTIYHEHLSYLSLRPLIGFFGRFNMEVFDVHERDIHGGSFRVHVARKGARPVSDAVPKMLAREERMALYSDQVLDNFSKSVQQNRDDLRSLLHRLKSEGNRIAGVSAPAKGMTLLNYCRIGRETLEFITEKSTLKIGRFTPGTHIPVLPDSELLVQMPEYVLLLAWNFAQEIMQNLKEYRDRGGKFIIPIPRPHVV